MFNIKKIRPLFTGIITTAMTYVGDQNTKKGSILIDTTRLSGTMNPYQTIVAVGDMVHNLKPGDIVRLNFNRYAKGKHTPGKIEENIQKDNFSAVYEFPIVVINDVKYLFLQHNDVEFVVEEYDVDEGGLLQ